MKQYANPHRYCSDVYFKALYVVLITVPIGWAVLGVVHVMRIFLRIDFALTSVILTAYKPVMTHTDDEFNQRDKEKRRTVQINQ